MNPLLSKLREDRAALQSTVDAILSGAAAENRSDLSDAETRNFDDSIVRLKALDERIAQLSELELRAAESASLQARVDDATGGAPRFAGGVRVGREERTYRQDRDGGSAFLRDVALATINGDLGARERLNRHQSEERAENRDLASSDFSGGAGAGLGGFIPPAFLIADYMEFTRGGRPVANAIGSRGAPPAEVMNVPRITAGVTAMSVQSSENADLGEKSLSTDQKVFKTYTVGSYVDVSQQSLDFATGLDGILRGDMMAAHATDVEGFVLSSTQTYGKGIFTLSGTIAVTYTDASPTVAELQAKVASAKAQIGSGRKAGAQLLICDPSRWEWIISQTDGSGRPIIAPSANTALPSFGTYSASGESFVPSFAGLPVVQSYSVGTTSFAPTGTDAIAVCRPSDYLFYESAPRVEVFREPGSATGTVRYRLMSYVAFTAERNLYSTAVIQGSGLLAFT